MGESSQTHVDRYFASEARFWLELYERSDVFAAIHRERRTRALAWVDGLGLPAGARVLEVGCGAGLTAVELARRGFAVDATDTVAEMREQTARRARDAGVELRVAHADAHRLAYDDGSFDLVLALGVVPWLHDPGRAIREVARVTRRGGSVILSADNRRRLIGLVDPALAPALAKPRELVRRLLRRPAWQGVRPLQHTPGAFDAMLAGAGLERVDTATLGFGPFTFMWRPALPDRVAVRLHGRLQSLADRGAPLLRSAGAQYLVLARRA